MKRTRKLISVLLMLLLLLNVGMAEDSREFTADEQAYNAYLDITNAYAESVKYLRENSFVRWTDFRFHQADRNSPLRIHCKLRIHKPDFPRN